MEIDFLGLNSKKSLKLEKGGRTNNIFNDSAIRGDDISLSLSTSSSVDFHGKPVKFQQNETWAVPTNKMIPTCSGSLEKVHPVEMRSLPFVPTPLHKLSSTSGFLYDLNEKPRYLRTTMAEPTSHPALLTILHPNAAHVFPKILPDKANHHVTCVAGKSSSTSSTAKKRTRGYGYTPTVAMARKATLARFLEKRMHRLMCTKTSNLDMKSQDATSSQAWNVNINYSKNKNMNS